MTGKPAPLSRKYERIQWVIGELALLRPRHELEGAIADKFGISRRMARNYLKRAREEMHSAHVENREQRRDELREAIGLAYRIAASQKDSKAMTMAARELIGLDGCAEPSQSVHRVGGIEDGAAVVLPPEKARERLGTLLSRHPEVIELAQQKPAELPPAEPEAKKDSDGNG